MARELYGTADAARALKVTLGYNADTTYFPYEYVGQQPVTDFPATVTDPDTGAVYSVLAVTIRTEGVGRNRMTRIVNGAGDALERVYDAQGNMLRETQAAGTPVARTTEYRYADGNRITDRIVDPAGLALRTHYDYDLFGNVTAQTSANGYAAANSDAAWAQQVRASLGLVDVNGNALAAAQLTAAQQQLVLGAFTTSTEYDVLNRATRFTDELGYSTSFAYDVFGNQTAITTGQYLLSPVDSGYVAARPSWP